MKKRVKKKVFLDSLIFWDDEKIKVVTDDKNKDEKLSVPLRVQFDKAENECEKTYTKKLTSHI